MIHSALSILILAVGASAAQPSVELVSTAIATTVVDVVAQAEPATQASPTAAQVVGGLPQREPPPRTLSAFWPVYVGFVVALFAIVGFLVRGVGGRHDRLARAVQELESSGADG